MASPIQLQQIWMSILGPKTTCQIIHPDTKCSHEIIKKSLHVVKNSSKLYALLYLAMFAFKFRKICHQRKLKKTMVSWTKDYIWSLAFMSWIVAGMKTALCILNYLGSPLDGRIVPLLSILGSPSIICLQRQKRSQVVFFTFVRGCRSAYIYMKKRYKFSLNCQKQMCFVLLYGLLSYFYFQKQNMLRNKQFLVSLWGQF